MGLRYTLYRLSYELRRKLGVLAKTFKTDTPSREFISLADWRSLEFPFFFQRKEDLAFDQELTDSLKNRVSNIKKGIIRFFSAQDVNLGVNYDWVTNPDTGYTYDKNLHWSKIETLSASGDIKYVWEKSRFCYLADLIKYDKATGESQAEFVFAELDSWIEANPQNCGPNYVCSQEISIRLLNWSFALVYYRDAMELTSERLQRYVDAIYKQIKHVEQNINFSRICVRNNHALTECFMLYFAGVMFPFFSESKQWKKQGKQMVEEEVDFQFFEDGGYLQYSHTYHRVALQIMTWALFIGKKAGTEWSVSVLAKLNKSLTQLNSLMSEKNGHLPNYGNNDGALFFQWSESDYRDFRPQLNALSYALQDGLYYTNTSALSEVKWYTGSINLPSLQPSFAVSFEIAGLYILQHKELKIIIKCTTHKHRPAQADNLHIDVWYKGENILYDGGSYKYNTAEEELNYFMGTASHNTVMLGDFNQMKKASRFIWNYWTTCSDVHLEETENTFTFTGTIKAYQELNSAITHTRKVTLHRKLPRVEIEDTIGNKPTGLEMKQFWHSPKNDLFALLSKAKTTSKQMWHSPIYGQRETSHAYICTTTENTLKTIITIP